MKTMMKALGLVILGIAALSARTTAAPGGAAEAFEKLKSLVGHWETGKTNMNKASLVLEKSHMVEDGKPVEMTTLYYLDGSDVKLTHYCMAGNQPTMRGAYSPETKTLTFELVSISNLKSADDGHMHHATYTFLDNDHFKTTWTFRKDQKDAFTEDVTYVRVK